MVDGWSQPFRSADITHTALYSCLALVIFCISKENIFISGKNYFPHFANFNKERDYQWSIIRNNASFTVYRAVMYDVNILPITLLLTLKIKKKIIVSGQELI